VRRDPCQRTGDIGLVTLVSEGAVAAGVRRIEALTGAEARAHLDEQDKRVRELAIALLKVGAGDVTARVAQLVEDRRRLKRNWLTPRKKLAMGGGAGEAVARSRKPVRSS
jgi:alanyl-tRNA synthetase